MVLTSTNRWLPVIFLFFLIPGNLIAQQSPADSLMYQKAVSNVVALYHKSSGNQSGLYNGSQYGSYPFTFKEGHPFFYSEELAPGYIIYNGIRYDNLMIHYDEVKEAVIINDSSVVDIQLINERVEAFEIFNHRFVRLVKDSSRPALLASGFYNLLYNGNEARLYKKEVKSIREVIRDSEVFRFIDIKTHYYIEKENRFYEVSSKKNLLNPFGDKKKELQQYINANHLNFRKDRDNTLIKITEYYNGLKK